jgi:virulence-associated protein VagC
MYEDLVEALPEEELRLAQEVVDGDLLVLEPVHQPYHDLLLLRRQLRQNIYRE